VSSLFMDAQVQGSAYTTTLPDVASMCSRSFYAWQELQDLMLGIN